jgi:hypothetical protein
MTDPVDFWRPGSRLQATRTFTATAPGVVDGVTVTLQLRHPDGSYIPVTPLDTIVYGTTVIDGVTLGTATTSGSYTIPRLQTSRGIWYYCWQTTGDIVSVVEVPFVVGRSRFL